MYTNPLSAGPLSQAMLAALPKSQTTLKTIFEAVALSVHGMMAALDFKLIGLDDDDTSLSQTGPELPDSWCQGPTYSFRYSHPQSSMKFIIKIQRLGNKALIHGLAPGDDKTASFEVVAAEFLDPSKFPFTLDKDQATTDSTIATHVFLSDGRLSDFAKLFKIAIAQKLTPALYKEGYEEAQDPAEDARRSETSSSRQESSSTRPIRDPTLPEPARPHPLHDPLTTGPAPRRPFPDFAPPGFENEHEVGIPGYGGGGMGGRNPLNIGEGDLYPPGLGPNDPLRPSFGPRGGIGGGGMGGGMHPTFDDPMFNPGGGGGGFGGAGAHPPGARYDPVGPGEAPRDGRGGARFPGGGGMGGMGGRPPNPFGGFGDGDFI